MDFDKWEKRQLAHKLIAGENPGVYGHRPLCKIEINTDVFGKNCIFYSFL